MIELNDTDYFLFVTNKSDTCLTKSRHLLLSNTTCFVLFSWRCMASLVSMFMSALLVSRDQIVGWPPVRLFRRQVVSKPVENFVKVNMDGMTVGRKVDLNAYESYEGLLKALEEMFQPSQSARESDLKHFLLSNEPEFVLTYEDQDGDWMLVGDVPWSMFASTVKRLRITRGLEANGTAPRRLPVPKAIFRM
ncbi:hypothetical protein KP509_22G003500 [Ceratopteris richardii]|uniref:Auxin-responsive protein n=1 Tax=Ceratopteris richardii TaxID=49495 RepID=A0A8T2S5E6_CERRI|nr:hypothetical protein KP509_22G003500 [Ceratopteris richardii]